MAKSKLRKKKPATINKSSSQHNFITRLKELCDLVQCDAMLHIKSQRDINLLNIHRYRIGRVRNVHSDYGQGNYKQNYTKIIKLFSKFKRTQIVGTNTKVSLVDLCYINALKKYINSKYFENKHLKEEYLEQLNRFFKDEEAFISEIFNYLNLLAYYDNLPNAPICSFDISFSRHIGCGCHLLGDINFNVYIRRPIKEYATINKQSRPIYKVFIPASKPEYNLYCHIQRNLLSNLYKGDKDELEVYIQGHAINRYKERTNPIGDIIKRFHFSQSLICDPIPVVIGQCIYIPCNMTKIRIGYFVAEIIDDIIVIKTFILATHASAPEGQKFQKLTGLSKHDMNYWDITKLETFINNTMPSDNPLYPYFKESGLISLFDLDDTFTSPDKKSNTEATWQHMLNCISKQHIHQNTSQEEMENTKLEELMV
ncbi:hypothetical protein [Carboxylicivirga sp. M1479]|uniref:hypothetical protein n=1 Tax=Carboxylicivirga sp. M1479 TaxID=2594476 RepID=UPI0011776AD8|nr:hypothetical protein [Carboxylicivirga sp. M1479]TRX70868.1 hypothetical protein FNN09_09400 [Carboxylicivirga sp. M1479]